MTFIWASLKCARSARLGDGECGRWEPPDGRDATAETGAWSAVTERTAPGKVAVQIGSLTPQG
jgi:hypothetical protein